MYISAGNRGEARSTDGGPGARRKVKPGSAIGVIGGWYRSSKVEFLSVSSLYMYFKLSAPWQCSASGHGLFDFDSSEFVRIEYVASHLNLRICQQRSPASEMAREIICEDLC